MYFSHEYLWNKDADQPVEKYVHMSMVIGESRLGTIFTNYTVECSIVAPAVARSTSLSTILIFISRMWVWVWVYVRWELLFAVVGVRVASVPMILLFSLSLSLSLSLALSRAIDTFDCIQVTMRSTTQRMESEWVESSVRALLFLPLFVVLYLLWLLVAGF